MSSLEAAFYRRRQSIGSWKYHNHILQGCFLRFIKQSIKPKEVPSYRLVVVAGKHKGAMCELKLSPTSEISAVRLSSVESIGDVQTAINVTGYDTSLNCISTWQLAMPNEATQQEWLSALESARGYVENLKSSNEYENLYEIAVKLSHGVNIRNRLHQFTIYHKCFLGVVATQYLMKECNINRSNAVILGNRLLNAGLIEHVTHEHIFCDGRRFYRMSIIDDGNSGSDNSVHVRECGSRSRNNSNAEELKLNTAVTPVSSGTNPSTIVKKHTFELSKEQLLEMLRGYRDKIRSTWLDLKYAANYSQCLTDNVKTSIIAYNDYVILQAKIYKKIIQLQFAILLALIMYYLGYYPVHVLIGLIVANGGFIMLCHSYFFIFSTTTMSFEDSINQLVEITENKDKYSILNSNNRSNNSSSSTCKRVETNEGTVLQMNSSVEDLSSSQQQQQDDIDLEEVVGKYLLLDHDSDDDDSEDDEPDEVEEDQHDNDNIGQYGTTSHHSYNSDTENDDSYNYRMKKFNQKNAESSATTSMILHRRVKSTGTASNATTIKTTPTTWKNTIRRIFPASNNSSSSRNGGLIINLFGSNKKVKL